MKIYTISLAVLSFGVPSAFASVIDLDLGSAGMFGVLAGSTVTNTGVTNVYGDLGVWPGTSINGFPPGIVTGGAIYAADAVSMQAESDLTTAYNAAAAAPCGTVLTGQDLGGLTLTPGVYCFGSSAQLTGTLTLNDEGDPNAEFLFQIGSTLTTASNSSVILAGGGQDNSIFWQVGSSATLGTTTAFEGDILASASITLNTGADIQCGSALASSGAVTMDSNNVSLACQSMTATPEPGTAMLLSIGLLLGLVIFVRHSGLRGL